MRPEVWAPAMWQTMHSVALGFPRSPTEQQKAAYRAFFVGLGDVIPCETCAASYRRLMLFGSAAGRIPSLDAALDAPSPCPLTPSPLFAWSVALHNAVNAEIGKAGKGGRPWTPEQARTSVLAGGGWGGARKPTSPLPTPTSDPPGHVDVVATPEDVATATPGTDVPDDKPPKSFPPPLSLVVTLAAGFFVAALALLVAWTLSTLAGSAAQWACLVLLGGIGRAMQAARGWSGPRRSSSSC